MKFIKNNFLIIIIFSFLLSFIIYKTLDYKQQYETMANNREIFYQQKCGNINQLSISEKATCRIYKTEIEKMEKPEFYEALSEISYSNYPNFDFVCILLLIIPSLYLVNKIFKDRVLINILTKESYLKFLKKLFLKTYRYIWIFPTILLIFILFLLSFTNINLAANFNNTIVSFTNKPIIFITCYILNSFFLSGIYLNISLLALRYKHKYVVACLVSLIIHIALLLFLEFGIDYVLLEHTIKIYEFRDLFSIFGILKFNVNSSISPIIRVLISFMLYTLSTLLIYFVYKNKEKLIIDCEKNNKEEI